MLLKCLTKASYNFIPLQVMERAMFHVSNTCLFENVSCYGYVCKTNLPSNTAFRGFGAPQAMLLGETMIFHIAETLNIDPEAV